MIKVNIVLLVFTVLFSWQINGQTDASSILENALSTATKEQKNVFVKYGASWCKWCKKMDQNIKSKESKPLFTKNYVFVDLVVMESKRNKHLEIPGAIDILKKHKGENVGLPFWVILNTEGTIIGSSVDTNGKNLGCPSTREDINQFVTILESTSNLKENELKVITDSFRIRKF
jgi:thiol-disulfide isomerase/thioredoxin